MLKFVRRSIERVTIAHIDIANGRLHQLQAVFRHCPKEITYIYTIADYSRQALCDVIDLTRNSDTDNNNNSELTQTLTWSQN